MKILEFLQWASIWKGRGILLFGVRECVCVCVALCFTVRSLPLNARDCEEDHVQIHLSSSRKCFIISSYQCKNGYPEGSLSYLNQ